MPIQKCSIFLVLSMIFELVYRNLNQEDSENLYSLWKSHGQIPEECEAEDPGEYMARCSSRVFFLVKGYDGEIQGSAGIYDRPDGLYFSTFVSPEASGTAALGTSLMVKTRDIVLGKNLSDTFKVELANKRLEGPGFTNELKKNGFTCDGRNSEGLMVWSYRK